MTAQVTKAPSRHTAFRYFTPAKRRATQYEEVTLHIQWAPQNYATQGYFNRDIRNNPSWYPESTRLKARDWWAYRDPAEDWYRPFVDRQAAIGVSIDQAIAGARRSSMYDHVSPTWLQFLRTHYAVFRYPDYGLFMCQCHVQRDALSDVVSAPTVFQGLEKDRHAQDVALYCMELESLIPRFSDEQSKVLWLEHQAWQPTRRLVERLLACRDWGEIHLMINLVFEPLVSTLMSRELVIRHAPRHGDSVTPVIEQAVEADREVRQSSVRALVVFLLDQDPDNRATIDGWLGQWAPLGLEAIEAFMPVFAELGVSRDEHAAIVERLLADWAELLKALTLDVPSLTRPAGRAGAVS
ncbi:hypothetical protein [Sinimarinibacterium flocculans]|uniref:hypothetical protein n=1 Tax=Sinimarinibacterium flocculans TaxID=985250 RepID=UPI00248F74F1|nr:hypothetical protein [Sinimarinibacterium flocculans]